MRTVHGPSTVSKEAKPLVDAYEWMAECILLR